MAEPARYLPTCTSEQVKNELARISFPPAQEIEHLVVGGEFHQVFRLTFSNSDYDSIVAKAGLREKLEPLAANQPLSTPVIKEIANDHVQPSTSFILRISGAHMPIIKNAGEVGILTYLSRHTSIPVPRIVHHDNTTLNALEHEYMIMTRCPGTAGSILYSSLTTAQMDHILDHLVSICLELYDLDFHHVGGLRPDLDKNETTISKSQTQHELSQGFQSSSSIETVPGPPILETMWFEPDIKRYWYSIMTATTTTASDKHPQTIHSLNAVSSTGYPTYTSWLIAQMHTYTTALRTHPSLQWTLQQDHPNLRALETFQNLLETSSELQEKLNDVPLKLAHRDLHFGNILLVPAPSTTTTDSSNNNSDHLYQISGVIDWEFSTILPFPLWRCAFLWSADKARPWNTARGEMNRLYEIWERKVKETTGEKGEEMLRDARWRCREQEWAWDIVNYLRCVLEVCPRGKQEEDARRWWLEVERRLERFGIVMVGDDGGDGDVGGEGEG